MTRYAIEFETTGTDPGINRLRRLLKALLRRFGFRCRDVREVPNA